MITLPKNKKIIASFEDLLDNIESSTPLNLKETNAQKNERIAFLLTNFTAFCIYYFDTYCYAPFGHFHKEIQPNVYDKPNNIFLEQLSRGFAKSTIFGLFLPLFIKFNGRLNGMIVGSATQDLAAEKLADLQANLQANKRIINDLANKCLMVIGKMDFLKQKIMSLFTASVKHSRLGVYVSSGNVQTMV